MVYLTRRKALTAGLTLACAPALMRTASANGDGFFGLEQLGPIEFMYYGTVRDTDDGYLTDAQVTMTVTNPDLIYNEFSDVIGHYRMPDVGRYLVDNNHKVDPSTFKLFCTMDGYKQVRKLDRRPGRLTKGAFEVNFTMQKLK